MAYFSNGSEGETLDEQCAKCPIGRHPDAPCPVLFVQLNYNYEQITDGEPNQIAELLNYLVDEKGICQMKPVIEKYACEPEGAHRPPANPKSILPGMEDFARRAGIYPVIGENK